MLGRSRVSEPPPKTQPDDLVIRAKASGRKTSARTGPRRGGLVAHQMWALRRIKDADQQRREQDRRERDYAEKQKRDASEIDTERYRTEPEYRRHVQNTQAWKSPEDKQRDRENALRALIEQQDRGR
jgi:hypothetical protein